MKYLPPLVPVQFETYGSAKFADRESLETAFKYLNAQPLVCDIWISTKSAYIGREIVMEYRIVFGRDLRFFAWMRRELKLYSIIK